MRFLSLLFVLSSLVACGDEVSRWDGPGCQPACVRQNTEGDTEQRLVAVCLNENLQPDTCNTEGTVTVTCPGAGATVTCEGAGSLPTCDGPIERPLCTF